VRLFISDNPHILAALLQSMERYVFGKKFAVWLRDLSSSFLGLVWIVVSDAASANKVVVRNLDALLRCQINLKLIVFFFWQKCGLHQMGRVTNVLLERSSAIKAAYSLTRVLQLRKQRKTLQNAMKRLFEHDNHGIRFEIWASRPQRFTTSKAYRQQLASLMKASWDFSGEIIKSTAWDTLVDEYLEFWNGDLSQPVLAHYCNGCCRDRAHCIDRAMDVTMQVLFVKATPIFNPSRWLKLTPGLRYLSTFVLPSDLGNKLFAYSDFRDEISQAEFDALPPELQTIQKLTGVRIRSARQWLGADLTCFKLAMVMTLLRRSDVARESKKGDHNSKLRTRTQIITHF
jgi:hypothetical protein